VSPNHHGFILFSSFVVLTVCGFRHFLRIAALRTLDVSKNNLTFLGNDLSKLGDLKSFNCEDNKLPAGSLVPLARLNKLQTLSAGGNQLGRSPSVRANNRHQPKLSPDPVKHASVDPLPSQLPVSLKQLKLDRNYLTSVPTPIVQLVKLEKLDLSNNELAALPEEICLLQVLNELLLDNNLIVGLPESMGLLKQLKTLSLKYNQISVTLVAFSETNPQPIPKSLLADTPLIILNLHGNPLTNSQLNEFEGFPAFLERRKAIKSKDLYGGALTNLETCGLN
jgi:Leucine-rich repeat (LRR) protein